MDISSNSLMQKFLALPRLARIRFLFIYADRASSLFFRKGYKLLMESALPGKTAIGIIRSVLEIADKYSFNPHLYTRKDLEWAKEDAGSLDGVVFGYGTESYAMAFAFEALADCCLDDCKRRNGQVQGESKSYSKCFNELYGAMVTSCSAKGLEMLHDKMNKELDIFSQAMKEHSWTDDSPPRGAVVFAGWGDDKPDGWPLGAEVGFWGNALVEMSKKLPVNVFKILFR